MADDQAEMNLFVEALWTIYTVIKIWLLSIYRFFINPAPKLVAGEVVLITGGGSGLGREMALEFARHDAIIVSWDINEPGNQQTVKMVKDAGGKAFAYTVDISNRNEVQKWGKKVRSDIGEVDILVNNAGIVTGKNMLDCEDEKIIKSFEVNALSHFWTTRCFLPSMMERNHGHIVNIASSAGLIGVNKMSDYCASKFADVGFTDCLELELAETDKDNVHVTLVCPYFIDTGMFGGCIPRFNWLLPVLDPVWVAQKIVHAVRINQKQLCIPRIVYIISVTKALLPVDAQMVIHKFLGSSNFMDNFVGRKKEQ